MLSSRSPTEKESSESGAALFSPNWAEVSEGRAACQNPPRSPDLPHVGSRHRRLATFFMSHSTTAVMISTQLRTRQRRRFGTRRECVRVCVFTAAGDAELTCTSAAAAAPSAPRRCVRRAQLVNGPSGWNASSSCARAARNRNLFTTRRNAALMALLKMQLVCQHTHMRLARNAWGWFHYIAIRRGACWMRAIWLWCVMCVQSFHSYC